MRRPVLGVLAAAALVLLLAAPAAAAQPIQIPPSGELAPPLEFAAGEACAFPLRIELHADRTKITIWENADGSTRILSRGSFDQVAINTDSGAEIPQRGGYVIDVRIGADGAVQVRASGALFVWYAPGDPVVGLEPGAYFVRGHGTESYDPSGALVAARFHGGNVIRLCDILAGD